MRLTLPFDQIKRVLVFSPLGDDVVHAGVVIQIKQIIKNKNKNVLFIVRLLDNSYSCSPEPNWNYFSSIILICTLDAALCSSCDPTPTPLKMIYFIESFWYMGPRRSYCDIFCPRSTCLESFLFFSCPYTYLYSSS